MKKAFIFGAGGHARVIASMIENVRPTYVVTDASHPDQLPESTFFAAPEAYRGANIFIGIGDNAIRERIFRRLKSAGLRLSNCIAPGVFVASNAEIGEGVVVCPGAVVMAGAKIGDNVIVNTLSNIEHDCVIGDHSQVTVGVSFGGGVSIGRSCFIGLKTGLFPNVSIGDNVWVRAGSIVTRNQPSNVLIGGVPAQILHSRAN